MQPFVRRGKFLGFWEKESQKNVIKPDPCWVVMDIKNKRILGVNECAMIFSSEEKAEKQSKRIPMKTAVKQLSLGEFTKRMKGVAEAAIIDYDGVGKEVFGFRI